MDPLDGEMGLGDLIDSDLVLLQEILCAHHIGLGGLLGVCLIEV